MPMKIEQKLAKHLTTDDTLTNDERNATFPVVENAVKAEVDTYAVKIRMPSGSVKTLYYDQYAREEVVVD